MFSVSKKKKKKTGFGFGFSYFFYFSGLNSVSVSGLVVLDLVSVLASDLVSDLV
jgi:hypothetical protein